MSSILNKGSDIARGLQWALLSLCMMIPAAAQATEADWVLAQDEDRIQLYTRAVDGSPFLEVKATALINAPISEVAIAMGDGKGCAEWRPMCKSSEILSTLSDTEQLVYLVLDMPWPVTDRDMVIHSIAHIDVAAKSVTVQLESASAERPEDDYVRAISTGHYEIQALGDEQVELTYVMHTDLGGDLSANMINPRLVSTTYEDIKRLQGLAEK
jgi:START domain